MGHLYENRYLWAFRVYLFNKIIQKKIYKIFNFNTPCIKYILAPWIKDEKSGWGNGNHFPLFVRVFCLHNIENVQFSTVTVLTKRQILDMDHLYEIPSKSHVESQMKMKY